MSGPRSAMIESKKAPPESRWVWPFELLRQIGEGGMGVVYEARYVVNDRTVAVKMLPNEVTDKTTLARFEREMSVLKDMRHPNIVRCFGGACEDKRRFYAMELVPNGSLEGLLTERGRFTWEQVVEYGLQMCAALECSHGHGVIHRDLKPANFLIGSDGQLKLSDFGLASVSAGRRITRVGKTAGTFLYMAPEQIRGKEITPRTDLYALGCVLFELLTGRPPFIAETPAATLHQHCKIPPPRVTQFALDCPESLERLILKLLAKEPNQRPESAAAVARELRAVTQTVTVTHTKTNMGVGAASPGSVAVPGRPALGVSLEPADSTQPTVQAIPQPSRAIWVLAALLAISVVTGIAMTRAYFRQQAAFAAAEQSWIDLMGDPRTEFRMQAVRGLGRLAPHSEESVTALSDALFDSDPRVGGAAVQALADAGGAAQTALPRLHRLHRDADFPETRNAAERAIAAIESDRTSSGGWIWTSIFGMIVLGVAASIWYFKKRWHTDDAD